LIIYLRRAGEPSQPRMRWTPALHASFSQAVALLGGQSAATAAGVLSIMTADGGHCPGLNLDSVALHLEVRCA
jgi:SHAQKYF class myb-like DNA-binding protein